MKKNDYYVIILLFLIICIFFYPAIFSGKMFLEDDIIFLNYPGRVYVSSFLKEGNFPLWTPDIFCGYPIFAEGQIGILYPFNILFLFLPGYLAYNYILIFHYFLSGIFMYFFMRELTQNKFASFLSSIIFMFNGFLVAHYIHMNIVNIAIWLPLILYLIEKASKLQSIKYFILAGIILSLQVLAFHPQTTVFTAIAATFYTIGRNISLILKKKIYIGLLLMFVIGVGISLSQIASSWELAKFSIRREGVKYEHATLSSLDFATASKIFITPISYKKHTGIYRGWAGEFYSKTKKSPYFFFPNTTQEVFGYLGILSLPFCLVAIFLVRNKFVFIFLSLAIFSILLSFGKNMFLYKLLHNIPPFYYFTNPARFLFLFNFSASVLVGLGLNFISCYLKNSVKILLVGIILMDLFLFSVKPNISYHSPVDYALPHQEVEILRKDKNLYRIVNVGYEPWNERIPANMNLLYNIQSVNGYSALYLTSYLNFRYAMTFSPALYNLLNVKYIFTPAKINSDNLQLILTNKWTNMYLNKSCIERAFVVDKVKTVESEDEYIKAIISPEFNPEEEVVIKNVYHGFDLRKKGKNCKRKVKIVKYSPQEVVIYTDLANPGFLVLSDTYYPGWSVFVNGKEDKIYRVNYLLRGVYLQPGKHKIRFIYNPKNFKFGILASYVIILLIFVFFILSLGQVISSKRNLSSDTKRLKEG